MTNPIERFKKGQLVPKRLNMCNVTKSRHRSVIVFGADVEVEGRVIKLLSDGSAIYIKRGWIKRRKNGPIEKISLSISDVHVDGSFLGEAICIEA